MLKYLRVIFCNLFRVVYAYFAWIIRYSRHPERYSIEERFSKVQTLIRKVLKTFRVNYESINVEYVQRQEGEKPRLIVCNHQSNMDPLIFIALADKPISFVAKKEISKFPVVGKVLTVIDGLYMDRSDLKQSLKIMRQVEQRLSIIDGFDYVIFPEGTRNPDPDAPLNEFHHGSFRPGYKSGADILNFALYGTKRVLSKKSNLKKNYVEIKYIDKFVKVDYENNSTKDLAEKSYKMISEGVEELREIDRKLNAKLK